MRVAVDARTVYSPARRGTGKNLIDLYRRVAEAQPGWRFLMLHRCPDVAGGGGGTGGGAFRGVVDPFADLPNVQQRRIEIPGDRWGLWQRFRLPAAAKKAEADLLHCPANTGPAHPRVLMVLTIHDLIPLEQPGSHSNPQKWARAVGRAARAARTIVTPSAYSKGRIVEVFGVPADRVVVNHWAADSKYRKVTDEQELDRVRRAYGPPDGRPYVFAFSGADPRKNARRILDAYGRLPERLRRSCALIVVGLQEPLLGELRRAADAAGLDGCRLHAFAPEADIAPLLSGARVLCYPSLSEGFGLPVLDAFRCETPVLTSNVTSLPEVAGDAAVLVNPREVDRIAEGLERLLDDEVLRADLVARGVQRLRDFTWEACARRMVAVLEQAAEAS